MNKKLFIASKLKGKKMVVKSYSNKKIDNHKLFVVRKLVWAKTVKEAIKVEKKHDVHEVFIDEDWRKNAQRPQDCIGFQVDNQNDE